MTFHFWYNDKENEYNFIVRPRCRTKICIDWQTDVAQQNSQNWFGVLSNYHSYQPLRPNRSSSTLTLLRPSVTSSLRFANHSIAITVQPLWNKLTPVPWQISDPSHVRTHQNLTSRYLSTGLPLKTENTAFSQILSRFLLLPSPPSPFQL